MRVLIGRDEMPRRRVTLRFLFEPRDLWLGVLWNRVRAGGPSDRFLLIYVCVLPAFPLAFAWRLGVGVGSRPTSPVAQDDPVRLAASSAGETPE